MAKLFQLMKEYESFEETNNSKMPIRQVSKCESRVRMSNPKDGGNLRNRIWKSSELMKEDKSIEVMSNQKRQIHQESKSDHLVRMSGSRARSRGSSVSK
jgi:hypothetical protein